MKKHVVRGIEKKYTAYEMRKDGHSYVEIGQKLGITAKVARMHVRTVVEEIHAHFNEDIEETRRLEVSRIDSFTKLIFRHLASNRFMRATDLYNALKHKAEETGKISLAREGRFIGRDYDPERLKTQLEKILFERPVEEKKPGRKTGTLIEKLLAQGKTQSP